MHGSAPDIAGKGIANPIGQIWCAAMMLDHLGHTDAGNSIIAAIESVLAEGSRAALTPDLGDTGTTQGLGATIVDRIH